MAFRVNLRLLVDLFNSGKCRKSAVGYNGLSKRLEIAPGVSCGVPTVAWINE